MASKGNKKLLETTAYDALPEDSYKDAIVVMVKTEWNAHITDALELGCVQVLNSKGVTSHTLVVPGAVEIPFAINAYAKSGQPVAAFIALACVIKGDTPHFDYVCSSITQGITLLNTQLSTPIIYGVLTVNTEQQALDRVGGKDGHKGEEAGLTALKMILLNSHLKAWHM